MTEKQNCIRNLLIRAINNFNEKEEYIMNNGLCERCICARFAMYLERALHRSIFKEYTTDMEFDRGMGGNDSGKKQLCNHDAYLDLIVHKRGFNHDVGYDNLFAVEMKKQRLDFRDDKERLQILVDNKNGFCYRAGFAIVIAKDVASDRYELVIDQDGEFYNEVDF